MFVEEWVNCWNHCCLNDLVSHDAVWYCYVCKFLISGWEDFLPDSFTCPGGVELREDLLHPHFFYSPVHNPLHILFKAVQVQPQKVSQRGLLNGKKKMISAQQFIWISLHNGILLETFYHGAQTVIAGFSLTCTWGGSNQPLKSNWVAGSQKKIYYHQNDCNKIL